MPWAANTRKLSDLEYRYIAAGLTGKNEKAVNSSPFTGWVAAFPCDHLTCPKNRNTINKCGACGSASLDAPAAIHCFWPVAGCCSVVVARRLFDDDGGYVALALYCTSRQ